MKNPLRSPLFKQLVGAVIGATLAYGLYVGYQEAAPKLGAYVDVFWDDTQTSARFAQDNTDQFDRQVERQISRNTEIRERFAADEDQPGLNVGTEAFDNIAERAKQYEQQLSEEDIADLVVEPEPEVLPEQNLFDIEVTPPAPDSSEQWEQEWEGMEREQVASDENLPDSGVGMWLAAVAALGGAIVIRKRCKAV